MTDLILTVMAQARHARAVHSFISALLMATMPDLAKAPGYLSTSTEFCERIDSAIRDTTTPVSTAGDYVRAIVNASCKEMSSVCSLLKSASVLAGLGRIADDYLDAGRFREMLLRKDSEKLERLFAIVRARRGEPIKILMDVAAELDGRAENYDGMCPGAKRKAASDMKKVVSKVENIVSGAESRIMEQISAGKAEVVSCVDAVGGKIDRLKPKGRRRSRYTEAQRKMCVACWRRATENAELRFSTNGRMTHAIAFSSFRRELESVGIDSLAKFRAVLHSVQNMECEERRRRLDAQRDGLKKPSVENPKSNQDCGIISTVKNKTGNILVLMCAFAAAASYAASGGVARELATPPPSMPRNAFCGLWRAA